MSILLDKSFLLTEDIGNITVEMIGLFPRGHVTIIAGEPGIGKTWFMLSVAQSLCSGSIGLGAADMRYPRGKCLVFAGETGVRLLANRATLMGGIDPKENCRVVSAHECARLSIDVMMNTAIGRKNIEDAIREYKPDITFFDTMISFVGDGKDESNQVDVADTIKMLSNIASKHNTAMVLLHHFRKRSSSSERSALNSGRGLDEVIGSSAFTRLAALVIGIERKGSVRYVSCLKSWWQEFEAFSFSIEVNRKGVIYLQPNYIGDVDGTSGVARSSSALLRKICADYADGTTFSILDVVAKYGFARNKVSEAISTGRIEGKIVIVDKEANTIKYGVRQVELSADRIGGSGGVPTESAR